MKFIFKEHIKLFVGYTYSVAKAKYLSPNPNLFLLPKNKLNLALVYEKEGHIKAGFEAYYTGQQYLPTGKLSSPFWDLGFMLEKIFEKVSFYINAENMLDTRQSRYKRVVNEPHNNPSFNDIWTHTEGLALSVGFKLKL